MAEITQTLKVEISPELQKLFDEAIALMKSIQSEIITLRQEVRWLEQRFEGLEGSR